MLTMGVQEPVECGQGQNGIVAGTEGANGPDRITRYGYDNANRVTQVTSAYGTSAQQLTVTQAWSFNGLVSMVGDANGNFTTYEYDGFDRLRKIRFPNLTTGTGSSTTDYEQYTYDANSNVTQDRRRDGATISLAYDNLNRATTMTPSTGAAVSFAYDSFSRQTQAAFSGHTLSFGYDQLSRNTSAGGPLGTVSYQYDLAGRRTRVTWPDSFYAQYDYDLAGAVTAIRENGASSGAGVLATYAHDNLGRRTSVTRGNGVVTTYDFDAAGRLEELMQQMDGTSHDQTLSFTYNAAGQAVARTGSNAAYDWDQPAPSFANSTANGLNQIAALGGTSFTYDGRGNLTSTGAATYSYDVYNRLTGAGSATLAYDPVGRLHQTAGGGVTTRFLYDGVDMIGEFNAAGTQLLRRYVHGPGVDEPVVWYEGSGTTDRRWLVQDRLGSVIAVADGSGAAISVNTYDEYGVPGTSNAGRFQYTGQMWLPEAGLYHYKARAYAPGLGRFLQSDPILYASGMNLYAYVRSDPINRVDPTGLSDNEPPIIVTGVRTRVGNFAALRPVVNWGGGNSGGDSGGGNGGVQEIQHNEEQEQTEEQRQRRCASLQRQLDEAQGWAGAMGKIGGVTGFIRWLNQQINGTPPSAPDTTAEARTGRPPVSPAELGVRAAVGTAAAGGEPVRRDAYDAYQTHSDRAADIQQEMEANGCDAGG